VCQNTTKIAPKKQLNRILLLMFLRFKFCERLWQKKQHTLPHPLKEILKLKKEITMKGADQQFEVGIQLSSLDPTLCGIEGMV
jgi:hypothetical protein